MGYPMASNLRKKIPKESALYVNDVNQAAVQQFIAEHSAYGPVKPLRTAKEITEHSVSPPTNQKITTPATRFSSRVGLIPRM
jgi:hypothetical protein